jgi:hypothetical protein
VTQPTASTYEGVMSGRPALSRSIPRASGAVPSRDFTQDFQDDDLTGVPPTCNPSEACISNYQGTIGPPSAVPALGQSIYGDVQQGDPPSTVSVTLVLTPSDASVYHITGLTLSPYSWVNSTVPLADLSPDSDLTDTIGFQIFDPAGQILDLGSCQLTWTWDNAAKLRGG